MGREGREVKREVGWGGRRRCMEGGGMGWEGKRGKEGGGMGREGKRGKEGGGMGREGRDKTFISST